MPPRKLAAMAALCRFLVLAGLFFWLGGFTFYASVVVPVGQHVFGPLRQGFVTQQVTVWLNVSGALAILPLVADLLWDQLAAHDPSRWRRRLRWLLWVGLGATLLVLFQLHGRLDALLQFQGRIVRDPEQFRSWHRLYLWVSTVQWGCGLLFLFLTLQTWRARDRASVQRMDGPKMT